jgi:hypothetical protein
MDMPNYGPVMLLFRFGKTPDALCIVRKLAGPSVPEEPLVRSAGQTSNAGCSRRFCEKATAQQFYLEEAGLSQERPLVQRGREISNTGTQVRAYRSARLPMPQLYRNNYFFFDMVMHVGKLYQFSCAFLPDCYFYRRASIPDPANPTYVHILQQIGVRTLSTVDEPTKTTLPYR